MKKKYKDDMKAYQNEELVFRRIKYLKNIEQTLHNVFIILERFFSKENSLI
jgi:hypothetical protein